jgi:hypothetical protein
MNITPKQLASVLMLAGVERYKIFIKMAADWEEVWTLCNESGWALVATDDGSTALPLWPAMEYAEAYAKKRGSKYEPRRIELSDLLEVVLPKLKMDGVLPAVFPTPAGKGVTPSVDELKAALEAELGNY